MQTTYTQKNENAVQKKRKRSVSIIDSSSQSESLQRKADMANNAAQRAEAPRPNNTGMPDNLKSSIESLSGFSMDDVRVHYNSSKPATVQALAYTQGTDIHVAPGQEKCLPHEAWHVAQQMAGRVSPTTNINGMPVNDNAGLEHEADVMGEKAVEQRKINAFNEKKVDNKTVQKYNIPKHQKIDAKVSQRVDILVDGNLGLQSHVGDTSAAIPAAPKDFYTETNAALNLIKNQEYVDKILNSKRDTTYEKNNGHNISWHDINIIPSDSQETAFSNGDLDATGKNLKLVMNNNANKSMYFVNSIKEIPNIDINKGNVSIAATLLHELGHAYQFFLTKKSYPYPLDDGASPPLKRYPLLWQSLVDKDTSKLTKALGILGRINTSITSDDLENLLKYDMTIQKKIDKTMQEMGRGAYYRHLDADNMLMNEIPYNETHDLDGNEITASTSPEKKLGIRMQYDDDTVSSLSLKSLQYSFLKTLINKMITELDKKDSSWYKKRTALDLNSLINISDYEPSITDMRERLNKADLFDIQIDRDKYTHPIKGEYLFSWLKDKLAPTSSR
jgi:hypothetical protein